MSTDTNKMIIRELYQEVFNKRRFDLLSQYISECYRNAGDQTGVDGFLKPVHSLIDGFPDVQWNLLEVIADTSKVSVRWVVRGTHTSLFQNIPATGKSVSVNGMGTFELIDGKVITSNVLTDRASFLQQLGIISNDRIKKFGATNHDAVMFIDKFLVPAVAVAEFTNRMKVNRDFIKELPGFVEDAAYTYFDQSENLHCVTVATWEDEKAFITAREEVQKEYRKHNFDAGEMFRRLGVVAERGVYKKVY